jgi:hypothetical protein
VEKYVENGLAADSAPSKRLKMLASRQAKAPGGLGGRPFVEAGGQRARR